MSYKAAFDAVKDMNILAGSALVTGEKGGTGGAEITRFGLRLVQMYELFNQIQDMDLKALNDESAPLDSLLGVMYRFSLQTGARNQFFGHIDSIERHSLHDRVTIKFTDAHNIYATIIHGSTVKLQLEKTPFRYVYLCAL